MKIKLRSANNFESKKRWFFTFIPTISIGWENYGYQKVFMISISFIFFDLWIEFSN